MSSRERRRGVVADGVLNVGKLRGPAIIWSGVIFFLGNPAMRQQEQRLCR